MKKYIILCVMFLAFGGGLYAQNQIANLEGINYQAIAIDEEDHEIVGTDISGKPLYEREIGVRFTITDGPTGSTTYYQDEHLTNTDKYGLFSLTIGLGTNTFVGVHDSLLEIPWINGDQWLMVELSTKNDGNYKEVSYEKFMAVPYAFYTDDISDNSITTYKIVDETILAEDIATGAVETSEILDETILAEDIATGAVTTDEILDETILAEDIATGAVTTDEILNETILAEDIATGAVETSEILNGTILNEDIANGTIDLTTKVTGILPPLNGGTGLDASAAENGQILIGNGTGFTLDSLTAGTGIIITNTAGSIEISSGVTGVSSTTAGTVPVGIIAAGDTFISGAIPIPGVAFGAIIVGSIDTDLSGCMMTSYVFSANNIKVAIFNGTGFAVPIGTVDIKVLIVN